MPYPILDAPISPLRQRLIDDMNMRRFSRETQRNYLRDIGRLATFLGRSPDTATTDDLRRFQIEQQDDGVPVPTMNSIVSALRFFFTHTVDRPDLARKLVRLAHPRTLPVVLSRDEVARLLNATTCLKHQAALSVAYGAGLRVAEVSTLKVADIDGERMLLRVERGKGGRYRNAMLSQDLLLLLRQWWKVGRQQGLMHRDGWLFPGQHAMNRHGMVEPSAAGTLPPATDRRTVHGDYRLRQSRAQPPTVPTTPYAGATKRSVRIHPRASRHRSRHRRHLQKSEIPIAIACGPRVPSSGTFVRLPAPETLHASGLAAS
ncbi:site-specific integrase [Mesorhizobium sp. BR1-1-6]|uniref:tyrosine-type recombinase/integrase n=1 Tax=Mesorhizobium sp. BR1-1-6 TaxID=2876648 RepID=UPI001CD120AE|nr:site-specific integrase [Mesorhizobium sp. BR1-1-6]MBZ9898530.1 site-specific integrase [Mesorhizobium sp. BR1-1-6]